MQYVNPEQSAPHLPYLIAESPSMQQIVRDLEKIAKSQATLFLSGESGTGKEVLAGVIHALSLRKDGPFIKVNCAAMPDSLIESEFFGHERGAFTGALTRKIGRFELAHQGTLLLDEVTEIPISLQAKLLRAIQEQEFERVGGTTPIKVNVRILATSNRNMQDAVEQKIFREDLYYRLNVVPIEIPPLRQRREDILPLALHFLEQFCRQNQKPMKNFSHDAVHKLSHYAWPGNVRELANVIERAVILDLAPLIEADQLSLQNPLPETHLPIGLSLEELERRFILQTLIAQNHNRTKTAELLGIHVRTLRNKLIRYGV